MAYQDVLKKTQDNTPVVNQVQGQNAPAPANIQTAQNARSSMSQSQQTAFMGANKGFNPTTSGLTAPKAVSPVVTPKPVTQPKVIVPNAAAQGLQPGYANKPVVAPTNTPATISTQLPNFGDIGGAATATTTQAGLATPTGTVTDVNKIDTTKINPANYKYGAEITALGSGAGAALEKRNYDLGAYYVKQGKTDATSIKADLLTQPSFANASPADQANTVQAIMNRIGQFTTQAAQPEQTMDQKIAGIEEAEFMRAQKELGIVDATMANTLKLNLQNTINQMAVNQKNKDNFSNFDDISGINQTAVREFSAMRKDILESGDAVNAGAPVTQEEIDAIAKKTGLNAEDVKASLNGTIWQQLKPIGTEATTLAHDQFVEDETTAKDRAIQDLNDQLVITQRNLDNQITDIATEMERTLNAQAVAGALSGAIQSGGFSQGMRNIKDDYQKTINRLEQQKKDIDAADAKSRGRLLENYNQDLKRAKSKYETDMSNVKLNAGIGITDITNNYSLGSDTFTQALAEFKKNVDLSRQSVASAYYSNIKAATDQLYYNSEKQLGVESLKADVQAKQQNNLFRDNGAILYSMSVPQLQQQVKDGTISQATYNNAVGYMTSLASSTLSQMGTPTSQDIAQVEAAIKGGKSPQAAISALVSANPGRFKNMSLEQAQATLESTKALANQRNVKAGEKAVNTGNAATSALAIPDGQYGGECVAFVNDVLEQNGFPSFSHDADQTIANKISKINSTVPSVGSVMIRTTPTADGQKYGDVVIVTGIEGDTITYKGSNDDGNGYTYTDTIKKTDTSIKGYFDPKKAQSEAQTQGTANDISTATGLSIDAFNYLTKGNTALSRMNETQKNQVKQEAQNYATAKGVDISTFQSKYNALNKSLERTTQIQSNVQRDEMEIQGTLENLSTSADEAKFGAMKKANLLKMFAGEEFNDPNIVEYQFQLSQLQEEIAGYNAALRGDTSPVEADSKRAAQVIANGISSGGLKGLKSAMEKSVLKMGQNLPKSTEAINKQVWQLFGVGDKYKGTAPTAPSTPSGTTGGTKISSFKSR